MPEPQMLIPISRQKFDENGDLVDEETSERLRHFLTALAEWIQRFEQPMKTHRGRLAEGQPDGCYCDRLSLVTGPTAMLWAVWI